MTRKSLGWRWSDEEPCGAERSMPVMVEVPGVGYARPMFSTTVRCERKKGHKDWHCCNEASWSPDAVGSEAWSAA
jgi:hypothetical protein